MKKTAKKTHKYLEAKQYSCYCIPNGSVKKLKRKLKKKIPRENDNENMML